MRCVPPGGKTKISGKYTTLPDSASFSRSLVSWLQAYARTDKRTSDVPVFVTTTSAAGSFVSVIVVGEIVKAEALTAVAKAAAIATAKTTAQTERRFIVLMNLEPVRRDDGIRVRTGGDVLQSGYHSPEVDRLDLSVARSGDKAGIVPSPRPATTCAGE